MSSTNHTTNGFSVPVHVCNDYCRGQEWIHLSAEQLSTMSPLRRDEYHMMYGMYLMRKSTSELLQHLCAEIKQLSEEAKQCDERVERVERMVQSNERARQMNEKLDLILRETQFAH